MDIFWNGEPLIWHYIGKEYALYGKSEKSPLYIKEFPLNSYGTLPMKGPKRIYANDERKIELFLLRTSLVYLIRSNQWGTTGLPMVEPDKWKDLNMEGPYLGELHGPFKIYSRVYLPGNYTMGNDAVYLFANSGKIIYFVQQMSLIIYSKNEMVI